MKTWGQVMIATAPITGGVCLWAAMDPRTPHYLRAGLLACIVATGALLLFGAFALPD